LSAAERRQVDALQMRSPRRRLHKRPIIRSAPSSRMSARSRCRIHGSPRWHSSRSRRDRADAAHLVDIAGLVRGASKGEGLGNQFLANIREVDAIAHVVRCFEDGDVTTRREPHRSDRRHRDDRDRADAGRSRQPGKARAGARETRARRRQGKGERFRSSPARSLRYAKASRSRDGAQGRGGEGVSYAGTSDRKPVLYVCNVDEASASRGNAFSRAVEARANAEGAGVVTISAKIEAEIAVLPAQERSDYLGAIGLAEPGLDRLIRAGYLLLDLVTFFTAGQRQRGLDGGARQPRTTSGRCVHTDFERGFIRAETIAYDDYVVLGARRRARRRQAAARSRDYVVRRRRRHALPVRDVRFATIGCPCRAFRCLDAVADRAEMLVDAERDQHELRLRCARR